MAGHSDEWLWEHRAWLSSDGIWPRARFCCASGSGRKGVGRRSLGCRICVWLGGGLYRCEISDLLERRVLHYTCPYRRLDCRFRIQ